MSTEESLKGDIEKLLPKSEEGRKLAIGAFVPRPLPQDPEERVLLLLAFKHALR